MGLSQGNQVKKDDSKTDMEPFLARKKKEAVERDAKAGKEKK